MDAWAHRLTLSHIDWHGCTDTWINGLRISCIWIMGSWHKAWMHGRKDWHYHIHGCMDKWTENIMNLNQNSLARSQIWSQMQGLTLCAGTYNHGCMAKWTDNIMNHHTKWLRTTTQLEYSMNAWMHGLTLSHEHIDRQNHGWIINELTISWI